MKRVIIIGGGFAGLSAAHYLAQHRDECAITLIDKRDTSDFLPLLPDIVGGTIKPAHAQMNLAQAAEHYHACFMRDEVTAVDTNAKNIITQGSSLHYDYAILACGTQTTFYGNKDIQQHACALDSVADALRIQAAIRTKKYQTILVSGGGYTGIELIMNSWLFCRRENITAQFVLVERAPAIIAQLPVWMQNYVMQKLSALGIVVKCNTSVTSVKRESVTLSDGSVYEQVLFLWSAGVTVPTITFEPAIERKRQARLAVDTNLRVDQCCFAAGDVAGYMHQGTELRLGIQFSLMQGRSAAENILRSMRGAPLKPFEPLDLGYIVPLASRGACGIVLGVPLRGYAALGLHYFMCVFRTYQYRNKWGIIKDVVNKKTQSA